MNADVLDAIERRYKAAHASGKRPHVFYDTQFNHPAYALTDDADVEFWAYAPDDMAALLAEVRRLSSALVSPSEGRDE